MDIIRKIYPTFREYIYIFFFTWGIYRYSSRSVSYELQDMSMRRKYLKTRVMFGNFKLYF